MQYHDADSILILYWQQSYDVFAYLPTFTWKKLCLVKNKTMTGTYISAKLPDKT